MNTSKFDRSVAIFVGLGFPREIKSVLDAFQLPNEWTGSRGQVHQLPLNTCRAALMGKGDVDRARQALVAFAHDLDILAPDALAARAKVALSGDGGDELFAGYATAPVIDAGWGAAMCSGLPLRSRSVPCAVSRVKESPS